MRNIVNINRKWAFAKGVSQVPTEIPAEWNWVNLPHTWNGIDGQDGGNDYKRQKCYYFKEISKNDLTGEENYLEFTASNSR